MRALRAAVWIFVLSFMLAGPAWAVRLAVAPPPYLEAHEDDAVLFNVSASLWFRESLGAAPGVELIPEPRNAALFSDIGGGAWVVVASNLQPRFAHYEPVDGVLSFAGYNGKVTIQADTAAGRKIFVPASLARAALMKELASAAAFVAESFALPPEAAAAVSALPDLDGDTFGAICQARQTFAQWPRNSGESRLILLQPGWKKHQADPRTCAEVVRSAAVQMASKSRDGGYNATALNMGRMALPPILGTPFEEVAMELAEAAPAEIIPELNRIAGGLLKEATGGKVGAALDDLLDAKEETPAPSAGGAWASGVFTRPQMLGAIRVLARLPQAEAQATLARLEKHPEAEIQKEVRDARAATNAAPAKAILPADLVRERLIQLANDPDTATANEACRRLAGQRPAGEAEGAAFDLLVANPARRLRILEELAAAKPAWAPAVIETAAASNPDPYTRAAALVQLAAQAPDKARALALAALQGDGHKWVRLHAAAVLADKAAAADAEALRGLKAPEPAVRAYLAAALAKASGQPASQAGQPARRVDSKRNLAWGCGMGVYGPESPFDAYYCLSLPADLVQWKRGYDAGKIFFVRLSTVGNPGLITVNRQQRDRFWLQIDAALPPETLPLIDGLVFGEETMKMDPDALWKDGWRLFCDELKVDSARVNGDPAALTGPERQAWQSWAYERGVDGFNMIYDFVKTRYALERPGLQVCTFLPGEPGTPGLKRWKFDVGGIYDYKCDSRMAAYSLVRRIKTLWPERPVIWLSLGIGGYEMNPVKRNLQVPVQPMATRRIRCYADSVAAWMAGADTGWFSVWIFVDPNFNGDRMAMSGVQVLVEDIGRDSDLLKRGVAFSFKGAEEELTAPKAPKQAEPDIDLGGGEKPDADAMADLANLVQGRDTKAEAKETIDKRKADFARGFLFYQQYVYDCARVCKSLPRLPPRHFPALAVYPGATVWVTPPTPNPVVPGMALLNAFDFLSDFKDAAQLDLSPYKIIMVRDPGAQPAAVVSAVTAWLEKTDGLLYIQGGFAAEAEWGGPSNLDGKLKTPWPWAGDVRMKDGAAAGRALKALALTGPKGPVGVKGGQIACTWTLTGDRARPLLSGPEGPVLAVWKDPARFKGTVVFDGVESASRDYVLALREQLAGVAGPAAGALLAGPVLHGIETAAGVTAAATTGYYRDVSDRQDYAGFDLLTGEPEPSVGGGLSGALAATNYMAGHVAVLNGISLLAEKDSVKVAPAGGGLVFSGGGLVRLAAAGEMDVAAKEGAPLPAITNAAVWVAEGSGEGVARVMAATNRPVVYVRSERDVSVKRRQP